MCGRIEYIETSREKLEGHYGVTRFEGYAEQGINPNIPRYNIPPSARTPILSSENPDEIIVGHWGYIPSWAKTGERIHEVINARAETIFEKPYFKNAIESRRCLIPVTGFFEWRREGKKKTPYRFFTDNDIFSLAGLYAVVTDKNGQKMPHYAIITTSANEIMKPIHDRMPVIIGKNDERKWIDDSLSDKDIAGLMKPYPGLLNRYEISSLINSPRNDTAEVIARVN